MKTSLQRGFSLVSAIFLLVVVAALGAFAVTISTTQHQSEAMEVMSARAYQAALAGIEWATFNVVNLQPVSAAAPWAGCVPGAAVVAGGNLAAFAITVNCNAVSAVEGASTIWIYDVSAVAITGGAPGNVNYIEQVATAKLVR